MGGQPFDGRNVVVTGGARGIGDAIIAAFAEYGARAISLDLIAPIRPREGVRYLEADVADPASVQRAFDEIDRTEKRVDVLVNNAGIQRVGTTGELSVDHWMQVIGTNLSGAFLCNTAVVPIMKREKRGAIVHIASSAAFVGLPGRGPYSAAKAGLLGLTRVMAVELAPVGIRVNAVAPGYTRTGLIDEGIRDGYLKEEWMVERIPMGRLAETHEIARVVRFLASEDATYITGQVIVVDGGWTIQGIGTAPGWLMAAPTSDRAGPAQRTS